MAPLTRAIASFCPSRSCLKFHVNQESYSGCQGIALRSEGKNLKKNETVNRMKGVHIDDENAVKVRKI